MLLDEIGLRGTQSDNKITFDHEITFPVNLTYRFKMILKHCP